MVLQYNYTAALSTFHTQLQASVGSIRCCHHLAACLPACQPVLPNLRRLLFVCQRIGGGSLILLIQRRL